MGKNMRKYLLILIDAILINIAFYMAFFLRFDYHVAEPYLTLYKQTFIIFTLANIFTFIFFKQYKKIWRYVNLKDLIDLMVVITIGSAVSSLILFLLQINLPRSIYPLSWLLNIILIISSRIFYRYIMSNSKVKIKDVVFKNALIIGAGSAGQMLIRELKVHPEIGLKPVAILDDDRSKLFRSLEGVPIVGRIDDICKAIKENEIDEVIFAIPTAPNKLLKNVVNKLSELHMRAKTLPGIYELLNGKVSVKQIRDVDINDLLGRDPIKIDLDEMSSYIKGKRVMVTGGGGSIGSELCRQIAKFNPSNLIILDIYENNMYELQQELLRKYPHLRMTCLVASIRDEKKLNIIFKEYKPEIVFHAAAHKHVPLMEDNPQEAVKNNVYGTLNLVRCADLYNVKRFVMISTDKAVNPTSVMGATKRICEMIIQSFDKVSETGFIAVRFGNVLGSNGSIIPLFKKQIAEGGPVTVTHEDVKRYFMTIPEAVQLIIQVGLMAEGGEIFVLDMGEPVKIIDLARDLIRLSGFEPDMDIPIKITGLRPGEKLFEELLMTDDIYTSTKHDKIFIEKPVFDDYNGLMLALEKYKSKIDDMDNVEVKTILKFLVPEYNSLEFEAIEEIAVTSVNNNDNLLI